MADQEFSTAKPDLQAIEVLTPSNDDILQRKAGAWANRTIAQLKTDLAYTIPVASDTAYDATSWNANTDVPTKNAVRDKIEAMGGGASSPLLLTSNLAAEIPLTLRGHASQSVPLFTLENSGGTDGLTITLDGNNSPTYVAPMTHIFSDGNVYFQVQGNTFSSTAPAGQFRTVVATKVGLEVKLAGSQAANAFQITSSAGADGDLFNVSATGFQKGGGGANVASASAIAPTGNVFHVTGTTNITSITSTGIIAGTRITIIFDDILTFTDGNNLKLAGNFVTSADDTISLVFDGTNFYEVGRSVN